MPFKIKRIEKKIRHWAGRLLFRFLLKLIKVTPPCILNFLAEFLGKLAFLILWKPRNTILENLNMAFHGNKTKAEIKQIAKKVSKSLSTGIFELLQSACFTPDEWQRRILIEGKENLDQALSQGKGVIGLSAHMGNFTILGGRLASEGYPLKTIIKDPTDPELGRMLKEIRDSQGHKSIPALPSNKCIRETISSLKKNEVVLFIADENWSPRKGGIFVDFFGIPAATAPGPAVLSLRTGAPVVPMFIIRQTDGRYKINIDPPVKFKPTGNNREDIFFLTARFTKIIESYIKKYPEQWMWVNKRWKSRPAKGGSGKNIKVL